MTTKSRRSLAAVGLWMLIGASALGPPGSNPAAATQEAPGVASRPLGPHQIDVTPIGPSSAEIDATRAGLSRHPGLQPFLKGASHRLLVFELVEGEKDAKGNFDSGDYRATFFDYSHNRPYLVEGRLGSEGVRVTRSLEQPEPNDEEFDAAVEILSADRRFAAAIAGGLLRPYSPMPPLVDGSRPAGEVARTLAVGLAPRHAGTSHEIVGVDMIHRRVIRYQDRAPRSAAATLAACGPDDARQTTTSKGTAGQFNVTISRDGTTLWSFTVLRPAASSGRRGSGIELRRVRYRDKLVLGRAHAPILNVKYESDRCGPFRDWQWQENPFAADGSDVAPGIRRTVTAPATILENGVDKGNFRGVAIHDDGSSVQLVTEMQAGWYRYIMKWVLRDDGVIQPRFGFGGVSNSCVCNKHNHHAYWRFDFDIVQPDNNGVCQVGSNGDCAALAGEAKLATVGAGLEIRNTLGSEGYRLVPGPDDGTPDAYSKGSAWVLAQSGSQTDDGVNCTQGASCQTDIGIDRFVNGQGVSDGDVVVWYRGSFVHVVNDTGVTDHEGGHIVGPELQPIGW